MLITSTLPCLLQQKKGRLHLRDLLGWKEFDEVRDLRRSILLDLQYRSLVFAAEKGLPWPAVAEVGNLTGELLWETKGESGRLGGSGLWCGEKAQKVSSNIFQKPTILEL